MGYAQRKVANTASKLAHVSSSHLRALPPKHSLLPAGKAAPPAVFDAQAWAASQPPPRSTLAAFAHRIGLGKVVPSVDVIEQACTHPSFVHLHNQQHPDQPLPATNASLATLGNSLLGMFATEFVNSSYPHLPTRVMKAAVSAHVGPTTCANLAREMGVTPILRWHRTPANLTQGAVLHIDALASVPRALTALVYQYRSLRSARRFVEKFFFSREVDLRSMMKFRDPKQTLLATVQKFGRERPISRLLKETGRLSNSPVFVVGIFSGADKLGEGFGSSLKMAEYRAAEDSLLRLYLTRQPPHLLQLPTSTFPDAPGNVFEATGAESAYSPVSLGDSEVLYGSAGRAGVRTPGARSRAAEAEDDLEDYVL
ncbi:60S ribosomal protein L3 [Dichomitus squalens LYAD-421 SS1]|uniref:60S ribosomal protein L3 n=1 Tax=Dichomitus squalens (strain LYAD-421) TaxID=732165 RepID=UPI000441516F|nr:60S ribosomal protein L3 [Dichomitus squalens LYAD-421 SS1]EJF64243.1 60S ribosomal protein L3 [Dichomitus squalens LYAD-421 SS1]